MTIDTWIDGELVTVDTEDVWADTFAHWDGLVPTEQAAAIATATVDILLAGPTPPEFAPECHD